MPKMILVRGLPGSGKSTKAEEIIDTYSARGIRYMVRHREADQYFIQKGEYVYDKSLVSVAHKWCQRLVEEDIVSLKGVDIIVSNTFTTYAEMIPYFILAKDYGYRVEVITCKGEYQNIHNVPEDAIQRMRERWED